MTAVTSLSQDSRALAVLCTGLGVVAENARHLTLSEWGTLSGRIDAPGRLFGRRPAHLESQLKVDKEMAQRIFDLLDGATELDAEIERLARRGVWIITRADADFPATAVERLDVACPPVLFGLGPRALLAERGVALLGASESDDAAEAFAGDLGRACAASGVTVVSSTERGVDRVGMIEALRAGGTAVGVVTDDLVRRVRLRIFREFVDAERLLVLSPYLPAGDSRDVGRLETRNRLIYGLVEHAVVVSCGDANAETWYGAVENLERGWVPLFVRSGSQVPHGNRALCERDGIPLNAADLPEGIDLGEWFTAVAEEAIAQRVAASASDAFDTVLGGSPEPEPQPEPAPEPLPEAAPFEPVDLFETAWPLLARYLSEARSEKDVSKALGITVTQARAWLRRAVEEKKASKQERPVRYVVK